MEISTKLFNQKAVKQFSKMNEDIQNLQNRVATGKNILRASDDPVAAVNLSVAKEQRALVERFEKNAISARQTLDLTDSALQQAINVVTRISELAILGTVGRMRKVFSLMDSHGMHVGLIATQTPG